MIRNEGGSLDSFVFVDTDRPIADYVQEARKLVGGARGPPQRLPARMGRPVRYLERAKERLTFVVPMTLGLIFLLLLVNTAAQSRRRS